MGLVAIAMMAGATGTTTDRVTGIAIGIGTAIVEAGATAAVSIDPTLRDVRRLTGARTAGPCKMVSANRTGATETQGAAISELFRTENDDAQGDARNTPSRGSPSKDKGRSALTGRP
jgi:hypothetical protein